MIDSSLVSEQELRWKCRRGMLELDLLLNRFVDNCYHELGFAESDKLVQLLDYPDQVLHDLLVTQLPPSDPSMVELIDKIRNSLSR